MEKLNNDCILYICQFLSIRDKIQLFQVCKRFYSLIQFKNDIVMYTKTNRHWIIKYEPCIILHKKIKRLSHFNNQLKCNVFFKLHALKLESCRLTKLPRMNKMYITNLNVSTNYFINIPSVIFEMTNLQILQMDVNKINHLPDAIGKLTNLQHLSLSCNKITTISPCIDKCIHLKILDLSLNQINELPESLGNLLLLQYLYLSSNKLTFIPDSFKNCKFLEELTLNFNQLIYCPIYFNEFKYLKYLDINNNLIQDLYFFENIEEFEQ